MKNLVPNVVPEERVSGTLEALKTNQFLAYFVPGACEARQMVLDCVEKGMSVGLGGSETLREAGFPEALRAKGAVLLDHWDPSLSLEASHACRRQQLASDLFLSSANAVTEAGEIVCCDGIGNRVAAMTFGPSKVILVVGAQKIVPDLASAFARLRQVAPRRARSLGLDLPCVSDGVCRDCQTPSRICRATLILHRRPMFTDATVILVGERLGW